MKSNLFRASAVNGWPLFWLFVTPMTGFMVIELVGHDLSSPKDVSHLISYSVRWAVPFIYFVVAASAMPVLFPGEFSRWWVRNRRYVGLVFAIAMGWQGAFIFIVSNMHTGYYYDEIYYLRDELEGTSGYLFLGAMVITSFRFGRQFVSSAQWKVLHRCGVYFLWAYPFSVYWWNLYYYGNARPIDYLFYWAGFLAFASRIVAWGKKRIGHRSRADAITATLPQRIIGMLLIASGIVASATGDYWREAVSAGLLTPDWSSRLELWLPFWPLEPFLPLFALGIGTWCLTGSLAISSSPMPPGRPRPSSDGVQVSP